MNIKRIKVLGITILLLFASTILISCEEDNMQSKKVSTKFSELIEDGNLNDLSLSIYYINPLISTRRPLSVDDLINFDNVNKIVISGDLLEEHIDLLIQIVNANLIPVERESYLNTRLCYVFETEKDGRVFEVAMGGAQIDEKGEYVDLCLFVNGLAVRDDDVFYDALRPFLTEEASKDLEIYFNRGAANYNE